MARGKTTVLRRVRGLKSVAVCGLCVVNAAVEMLGDNRKEGGEKGEGVRRAGMEGEEGRLIRAANTLN